MTSLMIVFLAVALAATYAIQTARADGREKQP